MPWQRLRKIVLESAAQEAADSYAKDFERFSDAWRGFQWLLARNPEPVDALSMTIADVTYVLYGAESIAPGVPEIWVTLTYNDHQVVIHDIYAAMPEEADEGA